MTNSQTIATAAQPAAFSVAQELRSLATITAMIMWQVAMPIAPIVRTGLRPSLSMYNTDGIVAINITIPTTPVARRDVVLEERPREENMVGA